MKQITKTIVLTAAQVNALDATDVNIIPAPKAGYQIKIDSFLVSKLSGTAVGSCTNDPIALCHTGETTLLAALDAVGAATNSNLVLATGTAAASYLTATGDIFSEAVAGADATAKGVDVTGQGATIGSFDGTLQVTVGFRIVKIG
jgi:hypothetical protein